MQPFASIIGSVDFVTWFCALLLANKIQVPILQMYRVTNSAHLCYRLKGVSVVYSRLLEISSLYNSLEENLPLDNSYRGWWLSNSEHDGPLVLVKVLDL